MVMRSEPGKGDTSEIYPPRLYQGAQMYILHGPVKASGHEWYEILPLDAKYGDRAGWVASTSTSGEPWIVRAKATCPKAPATVAALASLTSGTRLACFGRVFLTVRGRLEDIAVEVGPGFDWDPPWFGRASILLVDPTSSAAMVSGTWVNLVIDPTATVPDPLPVHTVVQVTGIFDHPAARACTATSRSPWQVFRDLCRWMFVVTEIR